MNMDVSEAVRQAYEKLAENERRLGVFIPAVMMDLLTYADLMYFCSDASVPYEDRCARWVSAAIDGFLDFSKWQPASESNWFDSVSDIPDLCHLIIIAAHSEAQLCLDYRESGPGGMPKVIYIEVDATPTKVCVVAENAEEFAVNVVESVKAFEDDED